MAQQAAGGSGDLAQEFQAMWRAVLARVDRPMREAVAQLAAGHGEALATLFYDHLMQHPRARLFLDNEVVDRRLRPALARWLGELFGAVEEVHLPRVMARQLEVGAVHARIGLPTDIMQMAFHLVGAELRARVVAALEDPAQGVTAVGYVDDVLHIADSLMLCAYLRDTQQRARREEAYRLIAMEHDVALERERQRAALSDWFSAVLIGLRGRSGMTRAGRLAESEFGMWLKHKGPVFFDGMTDLEHVHDVVRSLDEIYLPQLDAAAAGDDVQAERLVADLERRVDFIRYLISDLFGRLNKAALGRDSVTRLLNQRYLPTILGREVESHRGDGRTFSVLLARVDGLRQAVPPDDREGRDLLLQQMSVAIVETVRAGDHAFRYGEDEFLVLLAEADARRAQAIADDLRLRVRAMEFHLPGRTLRRLTLSLGLAAYDGHPDYQYLLQRAEGSLQRVIEAGGDRVAVA